MTQYDLYLNSGPRRMKTMVHVPQLLGCMANGPTTEEALERTPAAIRDFLAFLQRYDLTNDGATVDPASDIETVVVDHITEDMWPGSGEPPVLLEPDLEPVSPAQLEEYIARLAAMGAAVSELVGALGPDELAARPAKGRPIGQILNHVLEAEAAYMTAFGKTDGVPGAGTILKRQEGDILSWTAAVRARWADHLRQMSSEQLSEPFVHYKRERTARKVLRRALEHQWEHLVELRVRLEQ